MHASTLHISEKRQLSDAIADKKLFFNHAFVWISVLGQLHSKVWSPSSGRGYDRKMYTENRAQTYGFTIRQVAKVELDFVLRTVGDLFIWRTLFELSHFWKHTFGVLRMCQRHVTVRFGVNSRITRFAHQLSNTSRVPPMRMRIGHVSQKASTCMYHVEQSPEIKIQTTVCAYAHNEYITPLDNGCANWCTHCTILSKSVMALCSLCSRERRYSSPDGHIYRLFF